MGKEKPKSIGVWPAVKPFVNGGASSMLATYVIQPIDMIKVSDPLEKAALKGIEWSYKFDVKAMSKKGGGNAIQIVQRHHFASHLKRMAVVVRVQEVHQKPFRICSLIYLHHMLNRWSMLVTLFICVHADVHQAKWSALFEQMDKGLSEEEKQLG
ncbi:uncharacterized protein LOC114311332 isoform X2 [Camellia sinensis]|uniref:uncharacterized protein LOC114311332 isoform X2 n=1 Tax=Camellia sinensis TaxID=4442 RepID=UPI001036E849|nr:uncharacterized protein LOC114311332 isoform X2 [Camellia sinensis]